MTLHIQHRTLYQYQQPISISQHLIHLTPRSLPSQVCRYFCLRIEPSPQISVEHRDYFGNTVTYFSMQEPHQSLAIETESVVSILPRPQVVIESGLPWEDAAAKIRKSREAEDLKAREFVFDSPLIKWNRKIQAYASASFASQRPFVEAVLELTQRIYEDFTFDPKATEVRTPVPEVFELKRGVCQDFAHLQIACLRSLGLAARYVSGYLSPPANPTGTPLPVGEASHAWISVYLPDSVTWLDIDPTNNQVVSDSHATLAWGRDYSDVSPIRGVIWGGGNHRLTVTVGVNAANDALPGE